MPKVLKILQAPHSILSTPVKPVKKIDKKIKRLVEDMIFTLKHQYDPPGIGLAANQVGENLSLFILWPDYDKKPEVIINPKILEKKFKSELSKTLQLEGCLSLPKIWGEVKRAEKVLLEYMDEKGNKKTKWFKGLKARIVQHEVDHLNGILFTQRVIQQGGIIYQEKGEGLKKIEL